MRNNIYIFLILSYVSKVWKEVKEKWIPKKLLFEFFNKTLAL
jgi:hypothetical protein